MTIANPICDMIGGTQDVFYSRAAIVALPLIVRAAGIRMWDEAGNEYIDASCGPLVSCLGHGNERVIEAMASQARRLDYAFSLVARNRGRRCAQTLGLVIRRRPRQPDSDSSRLQAAQRLIYSH
jgi:adenosylmethionine-8-amino-7-oxononanoate aminotransferase